jgi:UDP-N-acetylmuramoyl-L-alanyl-D-glutamate--2,6-diaminopimelate ligase
MAQRLQPVNSLSALLEGVVDAPVPEQLCVTGLSLDSRSVEHGDLFVGVPGLEVDGRSYISQAVAGGAGALLVEAQAGSGGRYKVPCYQVRNLRQYIGLIASRFYGFPSRLLCVIGFTGTNGKTTCAGLTAQALEALGRRSGVIGTIGAGRFDSLHPISLTTPDAVSLQAELAQMVDTGLDSVCIEISSHALDQARVRGVDIDAAVFTNLSRDHLDYHGSMDAYAASKFLLFQDHGVRAAIINTGDPYGAEFVRAGIPGKVWTYGSDSLANVYPEKCEVFPTGIFLQLVTPAGRIKFQVSLLGRLNVMNLVAVVTALLALEYSPTAIEQAMSTLRSVPGRMELVSEPDAPVHVVVDFAHTPAALEQALDSLREHTTGRIWCVFGCGGERDSGKRSEMGAVADRLADKIVLTNDNPRAEDPLQILGQIESGIQRHKVVRLVDREEAIRFAINQADSGDLVLVAGKGHETTQVVGSERIPFSDRTVVANLLEEIC